MPAFGLNQYALPFVIGILDKEVQVGEVTEEEPEPVYEKIGFRLSDRVSSAVDRFIGGIFPRLSTGARDYNTTGYGWGRWLFMYLFVGEKDWCHAIDMTGNYPLSFSGTLTHNQNGVTFGAGGVANTGCNAADPQATGNPRAWIYRAQGFYLRTNNAVNERNLEALMVEPANGYTYFEGIYPRYGDGNFYSDLVSSTKAAVGTIYNRVSAAIASSAGFSVQSRVANLDHRFYRNGVQQSATDVSSNQGMGSGAAGRVAMLTLSSGSRNFCFLFSTKHTHALNATEVSAFNFYVQQLQVALQRNV